MTAAGMLMELDETFHARRLTAKSGMEKSCDRILAPRRGLKNKDWPLEEITASFAPEGWVVRAEAKGQVDGEIGGSPGKRKR